MTKDFIDWVKECKAPGWVLPLLLVTAVFGVSFFVAVLQYYNSLHWVLIGTWVALILRTFYLFLNYRKDNK